MIDKEEGTNNDISQQLTQWRDRADASEKAAEFVKKNIMKYPYGI